MRLLHGLPRRHSGVRVSRRSRTGTRTRRHHRRRAGRRRRAAPGPTGVRRDRRGAVRLLHAGSARPDSRPAAQRPRTGRCRDPRGIGREPLSLHGIREDPRRRPPGGRPDGRCRRRSTGTGGAVTAETAVTPATTVLDGCAVVTMDADRAEYAIGHVVVDGARIAAVGAGRAPRGLPDATYVDASGCLATPGFVNTHHHLYQWI